ncbi:hypothetical protein [Paracidobacterium acidisoli]|uniref:hypothetical protein n=1 Tax=Paracidobacterium acidisoli TaxID=2303751 RepID=UPI0011C101A5|nr:hypothetical protein [Paracidobacterium acidisoli]MBT9332948.1 hypothetical protein [Paracidobacterium acidisoli]
MATPNEGKSMKKILQGTLLLLLSGLCGLGLAQSPAPATPSFTLTISTAKNTFTTGTDIDVDITQKNISDHGIYHVAIAMGAGNIYARRSISTIVHDSKGSPVTETPLGHKVHGTEPHIHPNGGSVFSARTVIPPGKSYHYVIHLSQEYDLTHPGKYTIQAKERDAWTPQYPWVTSNVLTITIKP